MSENAKNQKPAEQEGAPHYHGHRKRLRKRFLEGGNAAVTDYEMLELVLFRALPRGDLKPLAKPLLKTFGSFAEVLAAPAQRLAEIKGLGESSITDLKIVHAAAIRFARDGIRERQVLSSWSHVLDYCRTTKAFADKEQFRILFVVKRALRRLYCGLLLPLQHQRWRPDVLRAEYVEPYRRAAGYIDRILKGEKPAELPVDWVRALAREPKASARLARRE